MKILERQRDYSHLVTHTNHPNNNIHTLTSITSSSRLRIVFGKVKVKDIGHDVARSGCDDRCPIRLPPFYNRPKCSGCDTLNLCLPQKASIVRIRNAA